MIQNRNDTRGRKKKARPANRALGIAFVWQLSSIQRSCVLLFSRAGAIKRQPLRLAVANATQRETSQKNVMSTTS